jgi:2'-5' RNA ligase
VELETLHATLLAFRLQKEEDLVKWEQILRALKLKKIRPSARGVGIFPVKNNYTNVFYLKIEGLDEIID